MAQAAHFLWTFLSRSFSLGLGLLMVAGATASHANQTQSAVAQIAFPGVEILRTNTDHWIALRQGAVTPFGEGDRLRTDERGRAYLTFGDDEVLVLPNSTLMLHRFDDEGLHLRADGRSIHHITTSHTDYTLLMGSVSITDPAQTFAIETTPSTTIIVVDAGEVAFEHDGESWQLQANEGMRLDSEASRIVTIADKPINFARVIGELDGCAGIIQTQNDVDLRVRAGPGEDFFYMGSIADSTPVQLVGFASTVQGIWYRIQFLSDFGWVLASTVETTCTALPELSPLGVENAPGIVDVQAYEIPLLEPFFGLPPQDVWFYRTLNRAEDLNAPN